MQNMHRQNPEGNAKKSVNSVTENYYWKPVWSIFRIFELEEYARAELFFEHPILDFGCGDGTFARILRQRGIVDYVDVALDYSIRDLPRARRLAACSVVQADIGALPLKTATFASTFANGVFGSAMANGERDIDRSLAEACRVLADNGLFVLSVPTLWFDKNLIIPRIYKQIGASWLAERYLARIHHGLSHYWLFDEGTWVKKIENANFSIEQVRYYFTPRQAHWWTLLSLQIFRVFAISKLLGIPFFQHKAAYIQQRMFQRVFNLEQSVEQVYKKQRAGFLLIVARKLSL
jgi:SAM-dependent methyltransferase